VVREARIAGSVTGLPARFLHATNDTWRPCKVRSAHVQAPTALR
jgi:hypothetical protein